jgi:hypothetical protein
VHTPSGICQTLLLPAIIMVGMERVPSQPLNFTSVFDWKDKTLSLYLPSFLILSSSALSLL